MTTVLCRTVSLLLLLPLWLTGCVAAQVSRVEADPSFSWDTLKRDQILMTPLLDLRPAAAPEFFKDKERIAYAERFKLAFNKERKDIRVFGAGGAFEKVAALTELPRLAAQIIAKEPLAAADRQLILDRNQEIRFLFVFAVTAESLDHDFGYSSDGKLPFAIKTYVSRRKMTVKLALWDSKTNTTVWIGTDELSPRNQSQLKVPNLNFKVTGKAGKGTNVVFDAMDRDVFTPSLSDELRKHPGRFPAFPSREPAFSGSFDDFALTLPMNSSEAKLIEYTHFSYHRPELGMRLSKLGTRWNPALQLGTSSIIYNRLRLGGAMVFPATVDDLGHKGDDYTVTGFGFGATADLEWTLSDELRLLTGAMVGSFVYGIRNRTEEAAAAPSPSPAPGEEPEEPPGETDGVGFVWPRAQLLFGKRAGFQWSVGGAYRFHDGIEDEVLKAWRPSPWSFDLSIGGAFRGF